MFLLDHVLPEEATGKMAEVYAAIPKGIPVPDPLILMSASPELAALQARAVSYFMAHDKLDIGILAMIRYLVACKFDYEFCINFNGELLKLTGGMSDEDLEALRKNPENAALEEPQKALLLFVLKVVENPSDISKADVEKLKGLGWADKDIMDAAFHGVSMVGPSILMKAFSN